jgi:hypothetical protein
MTLEEILALFPDNTSGQISAEDLHTALTGVWQHEVIVHSQPYSSTNSGGPATGKLFLVGGWANCTAVQMHNNASDGGATPWSLYGVGALMRIDRNDTLGDLKLTITGPPDLSGGTFGEVPVSVRTITGPAPGNNAPLTVYTATELVL